MNVSFHSLFEHYNEWPIQCNKIREKNKRYTDWEERNKPVLVDDMTVYIENAEESTDKLRELMSEYKAVRYKQGRFTKVNHLPTYQQWISGIWNTKHDTMHIIIPKDEILRYKSNKICMYEENYKTANTLKNN